MELGDFHFRYCVCVCVVLVTNTDLVEVRTINVSVICLNINDLNSSYNCSFKKLFKKQSNIFFPQYFFKIFCN